MQNFKFYLRFILKIVILVLISFLILVPLLFVLIGATHPSSWAFSLQINMMPGDRLAENYLQISEQMPIWNYLLNSLLVSSSSSMLSLVVLLAAAYVFSQFKIPFKGLLMPIIFTLAFLPLPSYLVGTVRVLQGMGLLSQFLGIILPFIINIRIFYYLFNILGSLPDSLLSAARLDGASELQIFFRISIPLIVDKIFLSLFFLFINSWNSYLLPVIVMNDSKMFTLPIAISSLADPMGYHIGSTFLGLLFSIIPIILLSLVLLPQVFKESETRDPFYSK